ncbi:hypothetical protein AB0D38_47385, partial [Streptomyces sp. NPDC048279]|uniref:hypothetical protein n=1 Tax=Streptomyces sp. NPDC048279 TaxID=3154714 RepID=UPI00343F7BA7
GFTPMLTPALVRPQSMAGTGFLGQAAQDEPVLVTCAEGPGPDTWLVQDLPVLDGVFAAVAQEARRAGPVVVRHYSRATDGGADTVHMREAGVR